MDRMQRIARLEEEIYHLRIRLEFKEMQLKEIRSRYVPLRYANNKLSNEEIDRYSRQLILPEIGVDGQMKLKSTSVLIVGAGGLGCPVLQYLCGSGVGFIGICDYGVVEKNNLHRQILYSEDSIGVQKPISAKNQLLKLNLNTDIKIWPNGINSENALNIIRQFNIVIDCSDNVATRYLLNDACYLAGKPLVSGSALKFEGQLTTYNYKSGPCYRCIFPTPPPPEAVTNCGDAGVLGPVTGVIGSLQALEAIKIALDMSDTLNGKLLIFDGTTTQFRTVRLRNKRKDCDLCSDKPIITHLIDYEQFCGMRASDENYSLNLLNSEDRMTVENYNTLKNDKQPHLLIDVRNPLEYNICRLNNSINIPLKSILEDNKILECIQEKSKIDNNTNMPVFLICRRGNDSQLAVNHLKEKLNGIEFKDIIGGLHFWHYHIDHTFPVY